MTKITIEWHGQNVIPLLDNICDFRLFRPTTAVGRFLTGAAADALATYERICDGLSMDELRKIVDDYRSRSAAPASEHNTEEATTDGA